MKENLENDLMTDAEIMEAHQSITDRLETKAIAATTCAGCKHWSELKPCNVIIGSNKGGDDHSPLVRWKGECHKNPPSPCGNEYGGGQASAFPITDYDCHCSQFEE